ncbi:MAG: glycosyltransferase family 4 protein [Pseudomonadota bacterium]
MVQIVILFAVFVISLIGTSQLAKIGLFLDTPTDRSNHTTATPRTGGLAIFLAWVFGCAAFSVVDPSLAGDGPGTDKISLYGALIAVTIPAFVIGLADDWRSLSAGFRLGLQVFAAALFVITFGGLETVPSPFGGSVALGFLGPLITVFWMVAFMNAFNFIDGANGMAGLTGACGAVAISIAASLEGQPSIAFVSICLAAAILGFLPFNFPSGRIFLGDAGALSIGFVLSALAILMANSPDNSVYAIFVPIVFLPLLFDVGATLLSRALRGQALFESHSEHAYQMVMRFGASHWLVSGLFFSLTLAGSALALYLLPLESVTQWIAVVAFAGFLAPGYVLLHHKAMEKGTLSKGQGSAPAPENQQSANHQGL